MSKRRVLIVRGVVSAGVAALLSLVSACSSGGGTAASSSTSTSAGTGSTATAGDSAAMASLIAAAKKEGSVTYYGSLDPSQLNQAADAFTKAYGIKVNVVRLASNDLVQRYASEAQSGKEVADVFTQSDSDFSATAAKNGWTIANLDSSVLPALATFPKSAVGPGYVNVINFAYGFEYNTKLVASAGVAAPTQWSDFLSPAWKGHILAVDPAASKGDAGLEYYWEQQFGASYLQGIKANNPTEVTSLVTAVQQVASGEAWASLITIPGNDATLLKSNAPIKAVFPDYTATGAHFMSISSKAPHPNAARLFANFLLTKDGATALVAGAGSSPLGPTPGEGPSPAHGDMVSTADAGAAVTQLASLLGFKS